MYPTYQAHPLRRLSDLGVWVTVNSDDPAMFGADLVDEYQTLADQMGYTAAELERLSLGALRASFLPDDRKEQWAQEFEVEFERLRGQWLTG